MYLVDARTKVLHPSSPNEAGLTVLCAKVGEVPVRSHTTVNVFTNPAEVSGKGIEADVLIFLTKSYDTDRTAAELPFL